MKCAYPECNKSFESGEVIYNSRSGYHCYICQQCAEGELNMVQIKQLKITAELGGKQVSLENISTETFEAIKALEKPKEIPVARVGHYQNCPSAGRLFLKLTNSIKRNVARTNMDVIAIDLHGIVKNMWRTENEMNNLKLYENIRPL